MTHYNLKTPQDHDTFYDEVPFIPPKSSHKSYSSSATARLVLPWILLFLLLSYNAISFLTTQKVYCWTSTDFVPAHSAISKKLVKFSSSLDYVDESTIFRVFDPEEPVFVGNETEVDGNWRRLINIEKNDVRISGEEATSIGGNPWEDDGMEEHVAEYCYPYTLQFDYESVSTDMKIRIEVFHSLHCLNTIRKRMYSSNTPKPLVRMLRYMLTIV